MEPIVTIDTPLDSLIVTGTNIASGYIYDNDFLSAWYKLATPNAKFNKRPNAHGTYQPDQIFTSEARIALPGRYFGPSQADAAAARNRLAGIFSDGKPIMVTVLDDLGATSRLCFVVGFEPEWTVDGFFKWTLDLAAPDPRRYGPLETPSTPLASASSGLVWPLGSGSTYWDWGTPGTTGRVAFTNDGNTTTYPAFLVGAGGSMAAGFAITEVQTGRTIIYPVDTAGATLRVDSRTERVTVGTSDLTGNLSRDEYFSVPPGATREYQFTTLGATTGAPTLQLLAADAYL